MITVRGIHKTYENQPVLTGIDLQVQSGETFVILGESGAGKSVLLRQLGGLEEPDSGSILIDNEDLAQLSERELRRVRKKIGFVFQESALFDFLTGGVYSRRWQRLRRQCGWPEAGHHQSG